MQVVVPFKPTTTVYNTTGATIAKGAPVYVNGNDSVRQVPTVDLARADSDATSHVLGLADFDIPNNSLGEVRTFGDVIGLDTTAWNNGQILYLSDVTAGLLTATNAQALRYGVRCAVVTFRNVSAGVLTVLAGKEEERDVIPLVAADLTAPARALDTNYTPHASRAVLCIYTVRINCDVTVPALTGTATTTGRIELRSDNAATPTTMRCQARVSNSATHTLSVSLGLTLGNSNDLVLTHMVPPGHKVRLVTVSEAGAPTFSLVAATEILL